MKHVRQIVSILALCGLLGATYLSWGQGGAATVPGVPVPMEYGKLTEGLRVGLVLRSEKGEVPGNLVPGGRITAVLGLDNQHGADLDLTGAFAWVFVGVNKEMGYFTEKLALDAGRKLAGESQKEIGWELADLRVIPYDKELKVVEGYPTSTEPLTAKGALTKILLVGSVRLRVMVYVPATKMLVQGNTVKLTLGEPNLAELSPEQRKALVEALLAQFRRDAFAGDAAHKRAVRLGKDLLPDLLGEMEDPKLSEAGQQWLAASVCDLAALETGENQQRAVEKICRWLEQGKGAAVIAYYGPKVKNQKLDRAILEAAAENPGVASWAARGYAGRREGKVRADLTRQVLAKGDGTARANLAEALVISPGKEEIAALVKLLGDAEARVRVATADVIAKTKLKEEVLIGALVKALDFKDETTRGAACVALEIVTGRVSAKGRWGDEAAGTQAQKQAIIADWREWYEGQAKKQ